MFPGSDEEFCEKFGFSLEELENVKAERDITEERDIMWKYAYVN